MQVVVLVCQQCLRYSRAQLWQGYARQCDCGGQKRLLRFETASASEVATPGRSG